MSLYVYPVKEEKQPLEKLLREHDDAPADEVKVYIPKPLLERVHPDNRDVGQILDFKGLRNVWRVVDYELIREANQMRYSGCWLTIRLVPDAFADEMTEEGTSQALMATSSAERAAAENSPLGMAQAGVWGIDKTGRYSQISRVYWARVVDKERTERFATNPLGRRIGKTVLMVEYRHEGTVTAARLINQVATCLLSDYLEKYTLIEGTFDAHLKVSKLLAEGGELPADLADEIAQGQEQSSTALVMSSNPDFLRSVAQRNERSANAAQVLHRSMQRNVTQLQNHLDAQMAALKNQLAAQMDGLNKAVAVFKLKMEKIQRLITTLEIYLGVHENLVQIAVGESAPQGEPITMRQQVLYADEEFGDPANGGITFNELPAFDAWLVDSGMYKLLAPELRCVVALKPRREAKRTHKGDIMPGLQDAAGKPLDSYTYLLIRNGDNLYRIQTPNIELATTLFPLRAEFQKLLDRMGAVQELEERVLAGEASEFKLEQLRGKVEGELLNYQKSVLLMQGLLFRTEVLHPVPPELNLMKPETYGGMLQFVYDAEALLPTGRLSFDDWRKDGASRIQKGTRVLVAIHESNHWQDPKNFKKRFTLSGLYRDDSVPDLPGLGVYQVDTYAEPHSKAVYDEIPWAEAKESERDEWLTDSRNRDWDDELGDWAPNKPLPAAIKRRRYENRQPVYVTTYTDRLVIRYNPGDTVYGGSWGRGGDPHQRKNLLGFCIEPDRDDWLFNYDELTLDDINFYLTSRVDRAGYADMMPFLYKLRDGLQRELKWENEFARLLGQRLGDGLGSVLPADVDLLALTHEAIRWYKLEKVKLKRSLTDKDAQALRMVEQRVRYYLRERHGLRAVDSATDYRKKTLIWHHTETRRSFVAIGFRKQEFVDACHEFIATALPWRCTHKGHTEYVAAGRISREMQDTTLAEAVKLANSKPGHVLELKATLQPA